jgi:hypothetical protein
LFFKTFSKFSQEEFVYNKKTGFLSFCLLLLHNRIVTDCTPWLLSLWPVPQNFGRKIVVLKGLSDEIRRGQTTLLDLRKGGTNIRLIVNLTAPTMHRTGLIKQY